jgi:hypothetical protein
LKIGAEVMAQFEYDLEFRTTKTGPSGELISTFLLVAHISDQIRGLISYPISKIYEWNGITSTKKIKKDIPDVQLRRDLILTSRREFVKSEV